MITIESKTQTQERTFHDLPPGLKLCLWGLRHEVFALASQRHVCPMVMRSFSDAGIPETQALLRFNIQQLSAWSVRPMEFNHPNIITFNADEQVWLACLERVADDPTASVRDLLGGVCFPDGDEAITRSLQRLARYVSPKLPILFAAATHPARVASGQSVTLH
ncbi:MAG: hypothetical protein AAGB27_07440 [Pseudomonadota bacterium]